ncbi:uncharacterized protein LOC135708564 [Ochlerotatus camptorhynchus]|uniref:uncharacterized protein LOC135708564 n=1 Tax=Ochlerotatus camptorhynchus TaxID=644619 RepID=UPI0031D8B013
MIEKDSVSREEYLILQKKNAILEAQLAEYGKVQTSCSDNLDSMRANLNALQELLVKCRAELSISAIHTPSHSPPSLKENPHSLDIVTTTPTSTRPSSSAALKSEIELLKAQLDIYKSDFAEERIARLTVMAEKNRQASELQQLQQQNRTLIVEALNGQAEQQNYSRRCSRMSQGSDGGVGNESQQQLRMGDDTYKADRKNTSYCQHCNGVFGDIHSLETHIDECPAY